MNSEGEYIYDLGGKGRQEGMNSEGEYIYDNLLKRGVTLLQRPVEAYASPITIGCGKVKM